MTNLELLIQKIRDRLSSNDLTATEALRKLAAEYCQACQDFNAKALECRAFLDRRMVFEANHFAASQVPPLTEQASLLSFAERDAFLELHHAYEWEMPPELSLEVISELQDSANQFSQLKPLLDQYRQVARQNDDEQKINVLRQIIKIDDQDEWRQTLINLEERFFQKLASDAKEAIINQDINRLQDIQQALNDEAWLYQPHQLVVNKVNNVVAEDRLTRLRQEAAKTLSELNDAYSAFDYNSLQTLFGEWQKLVNVEGYAPDSVEQTQVEEARNWLSQQQQQRHDDELFAQTIKSLENALLREKPMADIEPLMQTALSLERELPEQLYLRYQTTRQTQEEITRRHRLLKNTIIGLSLFAVMGLSTIVAYFMITASLEKKWQVILDDALARETSATCQQMYDELTRTMPIISQRPTILALASKISDKKMAEEKTRAAFQRITAEIREKLADYEANETMIENLRMTMLNHIVDAQEQDEYLIVKKEVEETQQKYCQQQEQKFADQITKIQEKRKSFFLEIDNNNLEQAGLQLKEAFALREEALALPGVRAITKNLQGRNLAALDDMQVKLQEIVAAAQQKKELWTAITRAHNFSTFSGLIDQYVKRFPDDTHTASLREFQQNQLAIAAAVTKWNTDNLTETDFGHQDFSELKQLNDSYQALVTATRANFTQLHQSLLNAPIYLFVFQGQKSDETHYFYFKSDFKANAILETCQFRLLSGDNQAGFPIEIIYGQRSGYTIKSRGTDNKTPFLLSQMKLIYPDSIYMKKIAPHIELVNNAISSTNQLTADSVANFLSDFFLACVEHQHIAPNLKLNFLKNISGLLANVFPDTAVSNYLATEVSSLSAILPFDYNWLRPLPEHKNIASKLDENLKKVSFLPFLHAINHRRSMLRIAASRNVQPVGFIFPVDRNDDGGEATFILKTFAAAKNSGELWLYDSDARTLFVAGSYLGNTMTLTANGNRAPLASRAIAFAPHDGKTTEAHAAELLNAAARADVETINWPRTWPRNVRDK